MSGLTFGFTGSYIFSQTIFTYRTGVHSRFIGVLILSAFLYIVVSKVNVLEVSPLFFLGSTLIFIGYDLMYEWLWEVRHQVFLAEYGIVWLTFFAIHVVGIDMGIVVGVLFAVVGQIVTTAQNSDGNRIVKRSRAVWTPSDAKILHDHAYNVMAPKIVTLEVVGTVFFGSALNMLNRVVDEIGLQQDEKVVGSPVMTPHTSSSILRVDKRPSTVLGKSSNDLKYPPKYLVLDLMLMGHLDASAARGCFLQLVRMCSKRGICVCASGATPKNEWMFRSHEVSIQDLREEESTKAQLLSRKNFSKQAPEKILLFVTVQEALEFCEKSLIRSMNMPSGELKSFSRIAGPEDQPIGHVISHIIGASAQEKGILERLVDERYHDEISYRPGQQIFAKDTWADSFYIVLRGCVVSPISSSRAIARQREQIVSGAGPVHQDRVASVSELFDQGFIDADSSNVSTMWQAGGVLGYMDFLLERPRFFQAIATQADTKVAKFSQSGMNLLQTEDPELYSLIQRLLLCASTTDLSNCTCRDV